MSYEITSPAAAPSGDEDALHSALPLFLAPLAADDDFDADDFAGATPGFEPLVLPIQASGECLKAHWLVDANGLLISAWNHTESLDS
jgi:hypothetical protein